MDNAGLKQYGGRVIFKVENVFVQEQGSSEKAYGTLLLLEKEEGYFIEWNMSNTSECAIDNCGDPSENWAMVEAVGYKNLVASDQEHPAGQLYTKPRLHKYLFSFSVLHLKCIKRTPKRFHTPTSLTFILDDGTTHGRLYFDNGGTHKFIDSLQAIVLVIQSPSDSQLFTIKPHNSDALLQSFDELDLFKETKSAVSTFLAHPDRAIFSGLAKLTRIVQEALIEPDAGQAMDPEVSELIKNLPIKTPIDYSPPDEPGYAFVDEKFQITLPHKTIETRESPMQRSVWQNLFDSNGCIIDSDRAKKIIFRGGVAHDIRSEVWKFLLGYHPWNSTTREREEIRRKKLDEYFAMKLQWKSMTPDQECQFSLFRDRKSLVEKDVNRTDRVIPFYAGDHNEQLTLLNDILMTYMMYNFDLGYVQGMSDLLSPILLVVEDEVDSFWCFVGFMRLVGSNFEMDQKGMKTQLSHLNMLLQVIDPDLYTYLDTHESSNMYFAFRWLLIIFKREFSMENIMRLWEVFWTSLPCKNFQLVIALAIILKQRSVMIENNFRFTEILKHTNDLALHIDIDETLLAAEALAYQILECPNLPSYIADIVGPPTIRSDLGDAASSQNVTK